MKEKEKKELNRGIGETVKRRIRFCSPIPRFSDSPFLSTFMVRCNGYWPGRCSSDKRPHQRPLETLRSVPSKSPNDGRADAQGALRDRKLIGSSGSYQ